MKPSLLSSLLLAGAATLTAAAGVAQVRSMTLEKMVEQSTDAVVGEILGREVIRIDHPVDGPELYYTFLTIEGRSLQDGRQLTVDVVFPGGFIDDENGVHNSEAPSEDEIRTGNRVVAFYVWSDNMGGDLEGYALMGSHAGIFQTVEGRKGAVVQGKGPGYAVDRNVLLTQLDARVTELAAKTK